MKVQQVYKITYMNEEPFKDDIHKANSKVKELKEQGFIIEGFREFQHCGNAMEITMSKYDLV